MNLSFSKVERVRVWLCFFNFIAKTTKMKGKVTSLIPEVYRVLNSGQDEKQGLLDPFIFIEQFLIS